MNRSNLGNVVTNGMQILSVGATTASRFLGSADSALSNMSKQEKQDLGKMRADKLRDETKRYNTKGENAFQHLSDDEVTKYREKQAEGIRSFIGENEESVDDYMSDVKSSYSENSEQVTHIVNKLTSDREFLNNWTKPADTDFVDDLINKGEI